MLHFGKKPENQGFELIPCGDYEVFIEQAEERPTKSGRYKLNMRLRIRDDVQQACQNRCLFLDIFQKTPEKLDEMDRQVGGYIYSHLYNLLEVTGILSSGSDFDSMSDVCSLLIGKEIRVTVYHEKGTDGVIREKINPLNGLHASSPNAPVSGGQTLNPAYGRPSAQQKNPAQTSAYAPPPSPSVSESEGLEDFKEIISDGDLPF